MKSLLYKGVRGAAGYAISKVFLIKEQDFEIKEYVVKNIDDEIELLKNSVKKTVSRLQKQVEITRKIQGEENTKIIEAHIALVSDPTIIDEIEEKIKNEKIPAAKATKLVMEKWENSFKNIPNDEYFQERAKDVRDVYTQVIKTILNIEIADLTSINEEVVIVASDLAPSQTSQLNPLLIKGMVTEQGSASSHTALMAENMKIPAVVGVKDITKKVNNGDIIVVYSTADDAHVRINPSEKDLKNVREMIEKEKRIELEIMEFINQPSKTADNEEMILEANIGNSKDAKIAFNSGAEGIGLMRSEFLYMENTNQLPDEETQYLAYKKVLEAAKNHPVTIRTLDIGGDKDLESLPLEKELNPFLGFRAIRISLENKALFRTQLRALFRASVHGKLNIMFPFIATVTELKDAKEFALAIKEELKLEKTKVSDNIGIGMMIEIPSTIWMASEFSGHADFFSIGTNDLVQYMYAVDRLNPKVTSIASYFDPALIRALNELVKNAKNIPIAMCGQMAGDPLALPLLVGLKIKILSMSPSRILRTRRNLNFIMRSQAKKMVRKIIKEATSAIEVKEMIKKRFGELV